MYLNKQCYVILALTIWSNEYGGLYPYVIRAFIRNFKTITTRHCKKYPFFPKKIQMYPIYSKSNWKIKLIYLAIWMQRGFFFIFKVQNDRLSHKKNYQINEDLIHWLKTLEQKMLVFKKKRVSSNLISISILLIQ